MYRTLRTTKALMRTIGRRSVVHQRAPVKTNSCARAVHLSSARSFQSVRHLHNVQLPAQRLRSSHLLQKMSSNMSRSTSCKTWKMPLRAFSMETKQQDVAGEESEPKKQQDKREQPSEEDKQTETTKAEEKKDLTVEEKLEADLAAKHEEMMGYKDQLLRALAEMENVRQRARDDVTKAKKFALTGFAKDVLDVADDLGRTLTSVPAEVRDEKGSPVNAMYEGVKMTQDKMLHILKMEGIEKFESEGKPFNPNFHDCLMEMPASESHQPGTVAYVMKDGYMIKERVLRAAQVAAVKGKYEAPEEEKAAN